MPKKLFHVCCFPFLNHSSDGENRRNGPKVPSKIQRASSSRQRKAKSKAAMMINKLMNDSDDVKTVSKNTKRRSKKSCVPSKHIPKLEKPAKRMARLSIVIKYFILNILF